MRCPAVVFAGQGAQTVGMAADLYEEYSLVRETFREAEEACGLPLRHLCFEGPAQDLSRTEITQPALLTVDIAVWRVVEDVVGTPVAMAGLSLGEYAALVAAGSLPFAKAVALVRRRGMYIQEAVPEGQGGMVAILGLTPELAQRACAEAGGPGQVEIANLNCPGQIVLAGESGALARAAECAKRLGARRAVALPVSAPFHTSLLHSAAVRLLADLVKVRFAEPRLPVVANLTAQSVADVSEWPDVLARQVESSVRWEESLHTLAEFGADGIVEIGPGKALAGFARRTVPEIETASVGDAASVKAILERGRGVC